MDKAKAAVSSFINRDGKHETTVHEHTKPAVIQEHVTPTRHENVTTVVDKEVHQDHYHTSVQPVHDREVLPEKHSHNLAGTTHREIHHGNSDSVKERHAAEGAAIKNTHTVGETQHTHANAGTVAGEHVHHHVHESVQPVVQKETIQPHVVHTTVPVHEVHHKEAHRHAASTLPAVSMDEFKKAGGHLTGSTERHDAFSGVPRDISTTGHPNIGGTGAKGTTHLTSHGNSHGGAVKGTDRATDGLTGTASHGSTTSHGSSISPGSTTSRGSTTTSHNTHKKASLMDKINPKVDADGDGKAGFMK